MVSCLIPMCQPAQLGTREGTTWGTELLKAVKIDKELNVLLIHWESYLIRKLRIGTDIFSLCLPSALF